MLFHGSLCRQEIDGGTSRCPSALARGEVLSGHRCLKSADSSILDRVWSAPQCGFASIDTGNPITSEVREKSSASWSASHGHLGRRLRIMTMDFGVQSAREFNGFQLNSLRNRTGNFQPHIREFFSKNRESAPLIP